jgi:hypothetical protein
MFPPRYNLLRFFRDLQESPHLTKTILQSADIIKSFFTLEQLNVMDNELAYVDSNIMKYMPRLSIIKLGGNQFHCDRRLLWLFGNLAKLSLP